MSYLVLARKWRPSTFKSVVGQDATVQTLTNAIEQNRLHHAYLFSGTHGVGKTTIARLFAKSLSCHQGISIEPCGQCEACVQINQGSYPDLIEVDAASRTKVEDTRELLDNVQYMPVSGRFKIYLIDEVHMLSTHSFNALLKTLEEPPPHVKFLLATTDPQKLPVTVLSRCLQFHLKKVPTTFIAEHLAHILSTEQIQFEKPGLNLIAEAAKGSLRDALSLLDQAIAHGQESVTLEGAQSFLGVAGDEVLFRLLENLIQAHGEGLLKEVEILDAQGLDFQQVLVEFQRLLHQVSIAQVVPHALSESIADRDRIHSLSEQLSPEVIQVYYQMSLLAQKDFPYAPDAKTAFEMFLLRMLAFQPMKIHEVGDVQPAITQKQSQSLAQTPVKARPPVVESVQQKKVAPVQEPAAPQVSPTAPSGYQVSNHANASTESEETTQSIPKEKAPMSSQIGNWVDVVPKLALKGLAKVIIDHCTLVEQAGNQITLLLDEAQKPLMHKRHEDKISDALSSYLGTPIKLSIQIGTSQEETPAKRGERLKSEQQASAEVDIDSDKTVAAMKQTFDATVTHVSVVS